MGFTRLVVSTLTITVQLLVFLLNTKFVILFEGCCPVIGHYCGVLNNWKVKDKTKYEIVRSTSFSNLLFIIICFIIEGLD